MRFTSGRFAGPVRAGRFPGEAVSFRFGSSQELIYHFENDVYLAALVCEPDFQVADGSVIFDLEGYYRWAEDYGNVSKDGSTFLLRKSSTDRATRPTMIFNWAKEVEEPLR